MRFLGSDLVYGIGHGEGAAAVRDPGGVVLGERLVGDYRLLAEVGGRLFPPDYFTDLYTVT